MRLDIKLFTTLAFQDAFFFFLVEEKKAEL